jgi:hypothetical protein
MKETVEETNSTTQEIIKNKVGIEEFLFPEIVPEMREKYRKEVLEATFKTAPEENQKILQLFIGKENGVAIFKEIHNVIRNLFYIYDFQFNIVESDKCRTYEISNLHPTRTVITTDVKLLNSDEVELVKNFWLKHYLPKFENFKVEYHFNKESQSDYLSETIDSHEGCHQNKIPKVNLKDFHFVSTIEDDEIERAVQVHIYNKLMNENFDLVNEPSYVLQQLIGTKLKVDKEFSGD